jgi:hypothetical protein
MLSFRARSCLLPGVPLTVTLHSAGFSNLQPPYTKAQASKASHHMRAWRGPLRVGSGGGQGLVARRSAAHARRRHQAWARGRDTCGSGVGAPRTTGTGRDAARAVMSERSFLACELRDARQGHTARAADAGRGRGAWRDRCRRNVAGGIRVLCLRA